MVNTLKSHLEMSDHINRPNVSVIVRKFLESLHGDKPLQDGTVEHARKVLENIQFLKNEPFPDVMEKKVTLNNHTHGPITLHIMSPKKGLPTLAAAFIFVHGGGFVLGGWPTHRRFLHGLVMKSNCIGVHIDYSLSPEVKFPVALEQIMFVSEYIYNYPAYMQGEYFHGIDPNKLGIVGNSVGGNLATLACAYLENKVPFKIQCLMWPLTTFSTDFESWCKYRKGFWLGAGLQEWLASLYFKNNMVEPSAVPLWLPPEILTKMPKTIITTNGNDILKDQGVEYGKLLDAQGVDVSMMDYPMMIHDFGLLDPLAETADTKGLYSMIGGELYRTLYRI